METQKKKPAKKVEEKKTKKETSEEIPIAKARKPKPTGIFSKSVIALSSGVNGTNPEDLSFSQIKSEITSLGGQLAPTIHRRISFLLVSENALDRNTQKVRKARRMNVPIVNAKTFLAACKEAGKVVDLANHLVLEESQAEEEEEVEEEEEEEVLKPKRVKTR